MDEVIASLEISDGMPKIHTLAKLVVGTVVGFMAGEAAKKAYVQIYHSVHSK